MPKFILNAVTTNPNIPLVPVYGFRDTFNRADADVLGVTSDDAKAWTAVSTSATAGVGIRSNQLAALGGGTTGSSIYAVDAQRSDGTLKAYYTALNTNFRLAARIQDSTNYLSLLVGTTSLELRRYVNNAAGAPLATATIPSSTAKTVEFVLVGNQVSVKVDGVVYIAPLTVADYATQTRFGVHAVAETTGVGRINELTFTPTF